ncbi:MAG TPA: NAD-dependent epimerase/dehydratase family protein, partial [Gemmatimonadales bacterium]|nr:NAD-dependent epimerase/dehydratase family protein [Gemmatimonadales bacterium]
AKQRYVPADDAARPGIGEQRPLDFHSPYGCSKGAADQYVRDYARTFGIPAIVFRMSCIYGPHQFGTEDQGWVAHFVIQALEGRPITVYGDGRQVRDVLYVGDLVDAFGLAMQRMGTESGRAFNIGGGPENAVSLLELLDLVAEITGRRPDVRFDEWRPGDQKYYVSDTSAFEQATGWRPKTGVRQGLQRLGDWLERERSQTRIGKAAAGAGR